MSKKNFFVTFLKKFNLSINSLLEKYLNKLNTINLPNIILSNKVLLTFVGFIILFLSYISIPHVYNEANIKKELNNKLLEKFDLNLITSNNYNYKFFPKPHFILKDISIIDKQTEISKIKKLQIFVSLDNLFSLKKMIIKSVELENANFNFNKENYNFFIKLLDRNFAESTLKIKDSNIFFRNFDNEVLFINKIKNMKYYYDSKDLLNVAIFENEIFNIPYSFKLYKDEEKKLFSKINLNFLKLQIENELDYSDNIKKGSANFIYNKKKSLANYELNDNLYIFNLFDKLDNPNFNYKATINFRPFFSILNGKSDRLDLSFLFNSNSILIQLLKTELLNHRNLNFDMKINANTILHHKNFVNISIVSKIQEGLVDIDNTRFTWQNYIIFDLTDTLIYVDNNNLILDGKLKINILNHNEIYKFLLTPKDFRNKIKKIDLNFNYNFDQKTANLKDIKIDDNFNQNVNKVMTNVILKKGNLQNKIYLKNLLNEAIKAYAG